MKMQFFFFVEDSVRSVDTNSASALEISAGLAGEVGLEHESLGDGVVGEDLVVVAPLLHKEDHPLLLVCLTEAVSKKKQIIKHF